MNLTWDPEKATMMLIIPEILMDARLISYAAEKGFAPKTELHSTLLSFQNGKKILQALAGRDDRGALLERIKFLSEQYSWAIEYLPEYFILERTIEEFVLNGQVQTPRHTRRTIIQKTVMPDHADFLMRISELLGVTFSVPFSHVTLFAWSDLQSEMMSGIGLNSQEDFEKYYKNIVLL